MCVSYCFRQKALFFNHEDCLPQLCDQAQVNHPACNTCKHHQAGICGLTRSPTPETGGCCHWNVELIHGQQPITLTELQMLGVGINETPEDVLVGFDISYEIDAQGRVYLDPDHLALPAIYGQGFSHDT